MRKRPISRILTILLAVAIILSLGITALADGDAAPALEVYTQDYNGQPVLAKAYTAEELAALAETKADGYGYVYFKGDAANAVAATEYVAFDALLADAGVTFAAGDSIAFICDDGPYAKYTPAYEDISARGVDADGNAVPTAVAISWGQGSLADGTVADIAAKATNSGKLRFVSGMTADEKETSSAAGKRMPTGVISITILKAPVLSVYTQIGDDGDPTLAKAYSAAGLKALAETKADGYGYVYFKGDAANAVAATEYVAFDALLADAGVSFAAGDKLSFICNDGPYAKYTPDYDDITARGVDMDGNAVPTAVAISWGQGSLADGTVADIAAKAYDSGSLRFVSGMTAAEKDGSSAAGKRMPTGVISITVVSPKPTYTDVPEGDWYYDAVYYCTDIGLVKGMPDGSFAPAKNMNMAELTQLLYRMAGNKDADGEYWWSAAEKWAIDAGILTADEFKPAENVTREFFFRMFYATAAKTGKFDMTPRADITGAADYADIDEANRDAISWAVAAGMVKGTSATELKIDPDFEMNRATACVLIMRYFEG